MRATAAAEAGGLGVRENEGMLLLLPFGIVEAVALGVVCGDGVERACDDALPLLVDRGVAIDIEGGGIAA